ncbi:MAG TPA: ISL3 family transposase [Anaerolineae bacterium]|nr:ISL3 family transposase [Anaerolineae bacterium]
MSTARISIPLDIPDVRVLQTHITEQDEFIITVESTVSSARCHRCGREIHKFHGYDDWVTVRHLPILGRSVYLRYRPKRYRCEHCEGKPTTTQRLTWHEPNSPQTTAYDTHLLMQLVNATVDDVSIKERLPYDVVLGVIERRIAAQVDWARYTELGVLGLDEIALKKGHRDFVVIVTARLKDGRIAILGVLPDREKATVKRFLKSIPALLRATIHTLCTDMYESYIQAVREALPTVRIVIDRFHVAQKYRDAADCVRKQELKRLKPELPKAEYQQLKGSLWAFRKNQADLQPEEQACLARLFAHSPALQAAYILREELTTIFEQAASIAQAQEQIRAWQDCARHSGLSCFDSFLNTLDRWWTEITNYFANRDSSGFVEGLNNKLKVLKRRCYGLFNLGHLFQRIFLDLEGYRLFA